MRQEKQSTERFFTVGELAKRCQVTVRTLQYYDRNGLLTPSRHSDGGRRLYGLDDLLRLQQILFYKGFGFPLEDIRDRLLPIDSAEGFADQLLGQKQILLKQMERLQETTSLIDQTVSQIRNSGEISIDKAIAIVTATKQEHFFSFVMHHFKEEELKALISQTHEQPKPEHLNEQWQILLQRLRDLHANHTNPLSEDGQRLASDWWEMVLTQTGGDPALIAAVLKAGNDMSEWPDDTTDIRLALEEWLSPALSHYLTQSGVNLIELMNMEGEMENE